MWWTAFDGGVGCGGGVRWDAGGTLLVGGVTGWEGMVCGGGKFNVLSGFVVSDVLGPVQGAVGYLFSVFGMRGFLFASDTFL